MSVDLKLLNKWLLTLVSPDTEPGINLFFDNFGKSPIQCFNEGMGGWQHWCSHKQLEVSSAAYHGMIMGIIVAKMSEDDEIRKKLFEMWIEQHAREKGENVVSFTARKVDDR